MTEAAWRARPAGVEVAVRVTPRGGRDAVEGIEILSDGRAVVKARVRAVPENGGANDAMRRLLACALGVAASAVTLTAGATARVKVFAIAGDPADLAAALQRITTGEAG